MAVTARSGSRGTFICLGVQSAYGTKVAANSAMIPRRFPVSATSLNEQAEVEDSNLISSLGADSPSEIGQFWAAGDFTTKLLAEDVLHLFNGILNPDNFSPSPTALTADTAPTTFPAPATNTGWPSKLQITRSGGTVTSAGKVVVVGSRRGGKHASDVFSETETIMLDDSRTVDTTRTFWDKVSSVMFTGVTGSPSYTYAWVPDTNKRTVKFQATDPAFPGWTAMLVRGGVPAVISDLVPNTVGISAGAGGIDATVGCLGVRLDNFRRIETGDEKQLALVSPDDDVFVDAGKKFYSPWGGAFQFGDTVVKYTGIEISVDRQLEPDPGFDGSRFRRGVSATGNRLVTITPTTYFRAGDVATDVFKDFQEEFRNERREALTFQMRQYDENGRQRMIEAKFASSQLTESPQLSVSGPGPIEQPLSFKALASSSEASEIVFDVWTEN